MEVDENLISLWMDLINQLTINFVFYYGSKENKLFLNGATAARCAIWDPGTEKKCYFLVSLRRRIGLTELMLNRCNVTKAAAQVSGEVRVMHAMLERAEHAPRLI